MKNEKMKKNLKKYFLNKKNLKKNKIKKYWKNI